MCIRDRVCVTGGGGGIGSGIARTFVSGGAKVYIASRRDLSDVATEISEEGPGECLALSVDMTSEESIKKLVSNLQELEGKLDVLVNNAALGSFIHAFEKFPADEWDQMMNANVRGPFLLVKESLGLLATAANSDVHASVVNIVSVDGIRVAMDNDWAYGAGLARSVSPVVTHCYPNSIYRHNIYNTRMDIRISSSCQQTQGLLD